MGKVLDVRGYLRDKVDSPMGTQYFDGKLGHGVSCEEGQVGRWAGGQVGRCSIQHIELPHSWYALCFCYLTY